jgi:hypothetical protein
MSEFLLAEGKQHSLARFAESSRSASTQDEDVLVNATSTDIIKG